MSAQIIPLRSRTLAQAWLDEDGDGRAAKLFDFQRQLNAVARETRDYIRAGQTFAAVYCAAALVPLALIARDLGPRCAQRALRVAEELQAEIGASLEGRPDPFGDQPTFDCEDDPA